jgi:adenylylsulfate kinase
VRNFVREKLSLIGLDLFATPICGKGVEKQMEKMSPNTSSSATSTIAHFPVIWLTGLPGSGKTTIAKALHPRLKELGFKVELLDGDIVRKELSPELGFTKQDREIHARRVVYLSKLLSRNGIISIVCLISPYREFRRYARSETNINNNFYEVYVKCSLETCIRRDPKGLYKKALSGEIKDLTGLQDPYEEPENPEIIVDTERQTLEDCLNVILEKVLQTYNNIKIPPVTLDDLAREKISSNQIPGSYDHA